nr:single-stranded DNA-binding protein [uncultured Lachnoanaerobaculum sp.]
MNRVILMGRLTRDPDIRYTSGENSMAVARYTLAIDRAIKKQGEQSADFINCVAFSKAAEFAEKYFRQGMRVLVSGRIQTGNYTNKEGQKVYTTEVIVDTQEFADSKGAGDSSYKSSTRSSTSSASIDGFMNIPDGVDDEGLPFN